MSNLYIGIMSGTSLDGIDAVILDTTEGLNIKAHINIDFPDKLNQQLTSLIKTQKTTLSELAELDIQLAEVYAETVRQLLNKSQLTSIDIEAIGCHGQTVYHQPTGPHRSSTQLGAGSYLAELTSITTVTDFRNQDMAVGGQGAPLVPGFHKACFASQTKNRIIINIGGISNCTVLATDRDLIGFDIGPGNTLMDGWIQKSKSKAYDESGRWAETGTLQNDLLDLMMADPYFQAPYPKSTGREYFNLDWLNSQLKVLNKNYSDRDIQCSLLHLTAKSISDTVNAFNTDEVLFCGGGSKNRFLIDTIKQKIEATTLDISNFNLREDQVEAAAFAWLAKKRLDKESGIITTVTGAKSSVIAGAVYTK